MWRALRRVLVCDFSAYGNRKTQERKVSQDPPTSCLHKGDFHNAGFHKGDYCDNHPYERGGGEEGFKVVFRPLLEDSALSGARRVKFYATSSKNLSINLGSDFEGHPQGPEPTTLAVRACGHT